MAEPESHKESLLGGSAVDDEPATTTHLRALGIASSGIIRGAVQFGSMQVLLPMQMSLMFPQIEARMLGLCIIIYGASKFCEPIYGLLCDHWVSSLGRRLPLLLISNAAALISLFIMAYSSLDNARGNLFMCGFVSCMFAINVAEVAYHGIIADEAVLRPRSHGILSGYKTAWFIGGAACVQAATIFGFSTFSIYMAQAVSVPFFLALTAFSMRVLPSLPSDPPFKLTLRAAADSYKLSPASHGVFFWVIVAYFFVIAGTQWERYLFFFVRDCISPSEPLARVHASRAYMACLVTCASGAVCYSAFACTRRFGNRLCVMCSSVLLACFTSTLIVVETPAQLYAAMAAIGSATGFIISSSFALALEHIPHNELESLSMCVFRVYGSGMAHLVTLAPLLHHFGSHKSANVPGFQRSGYTALFLYGCVMLLISAAVTKWRIKETAPSKD